MYLNTKPRSPHRRLIILFLVFLILAGIFFGGQYFAQKTEEALNEQAAAAIKDTVISRAVQCYVVEGVYPPSLSYLEEKYGLVVNHERFIVTYDIFASNMLPDVSVLLM